MGIVDSLPFDVSRETLDKLHSYAAQLVRWQKAKNLVAPSTLDDVWNRHFLDSAQLYPLIAKNRLSDSVKPKLLDIGSGAGFPGLVLGVMGLADVHMVEANGRKCTFMRTIARDSGISAEIIQDRIESIPPFPVDIVTSRACASLDQLCNWAKPFCHSQTVLWFLKGENAEEELTSALRHWNMRISKHQSLTNPAGVILEIHELSAK